MTTFMQDQVHFLLPYLFEEEKIPLLLSSEGLSRGFALELQEIRECALLFRFWDSHFYWEQAARNSEADALSLSLSAFDQVSENSV